LLVFQFTLVAATAAPAVATPHPAQTHSQQSAQIAKIKAELQKRGTGEKSQVKITFRDGSKITGFISKIGPDSFSVTNKKSRQTRIISNSEVEKIQSAGW